MQWIDLKYFWVSLHGAVGIFKNTYLGIPFKASLIQVGILFYNVVAEDQ